MRTLFSYPCINQLLDAVVCGVKLTGCSIGFAAGAVIATRVLAGCSYQIEGYLTVAIPEATWEVTRNHGDRFLILPAINEDLYPLIIWERALFILICRESEEFRAGQASIMSCWEASTAKIFLKSLMTIGLSLGCCLPCLRGNPSLLLFRYVHVISMPTVWCPTTSIFLFVRRTGKLVR